jgi:hypothetical protein
MRYVLIFLLTTTYLFAQEPTDDRGTYQMTLRPSLSINFLTIDVEDTPANANLKNKRLHPNYPLTAGLGLTIDNTFVNFAVAKSIVPLKDEGKYGKTTYFDFQMHTPIRKFLFDFYYQNYKGFYYESGDTIRPYSDIQMKQVGLEALYFPKWKEVTVRNVFAKEERYIQPAYSFFFGGGVYYHKATIPILTFDEDDFRYLQFGVNGGIAGAINLLPRLRAGGLIGMGFYYGTGLQKHQKNSFSPHLNYRFNASLSYVQQTWSLALTLVHNYKSMYFRNINTLGVNNTSLQLTYIKQIDFRANPNRKSLKFLGFE